MLMNPLSLRTKKMDEMLGGGLESGVVTNFYGDSASGKTTVAMQAMLTCLLSGKKAIFMDTEGGFSVERFIQMSGNKDLLKNVLLFEPKTFSQQDEFVKKLKGTVEKENAGIIVIDSVVTLYRLDMAEGDIQQANHLLGRQLAALSKVAREKDIPVIVTNQVYSDFDTGALGLVGGDIPKYWSKCMILLERAGWGKRKATIIKHRFKPEGLHAFFEIKDEGIIDAEGVREGGESDGKKSRERSPEEEFSAEFRTIVV